MQRVRWAEHHYPDPNEGGAAGVTPYNLVLRPGGVPGGNVFASWNSLYAFASGIQGGVRVVMDDSLAPIHIPSASSPYNIDGWSWVNGSSAATVIIDDGAHATWKNMWLNGVIVQGNNTTPFFHATGQSNLYITGGSFVQSQAAGEIIQTDGVSAFVFIVSDQGSEIGSGNSATFSGINSSSLELFMSGGSVADGAITGDGTANVTFDWDSSVNVDPSTLTNVTLFYESAPQQIVVETIGNAAAAAIIATAGIGLMRSKSGMVKLDCTFCVVPNSASLLTGQFTRDGAPIGPTVNITAGAGSPEIALTLCWLDLLPDEALHIYNFQATTSVGTLTSIATHGLLRVIEE
jgi:hypothetical protein